MTYLDQFNIHYQFTDSGHFMNAFIFNKCEYQLLGIIREVTKIVGSDIDVRVEPLSEGSIWSRLKLSKKDGKEIKVQWIIGLALAFSVNPLSKTLDNVIDWAFEYIKDGSYIHSLKTEKERLELEKEIRELRADSLAYATTERQNSIKRKVSNFYSEAKQEPRISCIGYCTSVGNPNSDEIKVNRSSFDAYIISDTMEDESTQHDVRIDIIAPVLRKRKIKWHGIFNSDPIAFKLSDSEFNNSVLSGDIDFTGGTYIICDLKIYTTVDKEGETRISGYEVVEVHACGKDDNLPEITAAEKNRRQKRIADNSPSLFDFNE